MGDFYGLDVQSQSAGDAAPAAEEILAVVEDMRPRPCPVPLVRLGGDGDGAYLLPDDLHGIRACFSPGVNNRKGFEDELALLHGIPSHMCDFSSDAYAFQTPLIEGMQTFEKKWLDIDGSDDSVSLEDWVMAHEPSEADDLLLQMDIEGAEYRNLLSTPQEVMNRFRIVVLELHGLGRALRDSAVLQDAFAPFVEKLRELFTCVHAHPNNCCGDWAVPGGDVRVPNIIELTWLRNDRLAAGTDGDDPTVFAPHPLDTINTTSKQPLHLDEYWLPNPRPLESRIIILESLLEASRAPDSESVEGVLNLLYLMKQESAGMPAPPPTELDETLLDVAAGKPIRLSTSQATPPHSVFHEGQLLVSERKPFFFHTLEGVNQFATIDLQIAADLYWLIVEDRWGDFQSRARFLYYVLHDEPEAVLARGQPVRFDDSFLGSDPLPSYTYLDGRRAGYVTIFSPVKTYLHLSAVRILGKPAD